MDVVCILEQATYKPGDLPPTGYLEWHEWAEVQRNAGIKQRQCGKCGKWKTPQEMSKNHVQCETSKEHGLVIVAYLSPFPICTQCEDSVTIPANPAESQQ